MQNVDFHLEKIKFRPNGTYLSDIHTKWKDNFKLLESHHSYIQWLFPIPEQGMNPYSQPLTPEETTIFQNNSEIQEKVIQSLKMMMRFYGIDLTIVDTLISFTPAKNCQERFQNILSHPHNNLRITRIIRCLGEVGLEQFQLPLVRLLMQEIFVTKRLASGSLRSSFINFFLPAMRNERECLLMKRYLRKSTGISLIEDDVEEEEEEETEKREGETMRAVAGKEEDKEERTGMDAKEERTIQEEGKKETPKTMNDQERKGDCSSKVDKITRDIMKPRHWKKKEEEPNSLNGTKKTIKDYLFVKEDPNKRMKTGM